MPKWLRQLTKNRPIKIKADEQQAEAWVSPEKMGRFRSQSIFLSVSICTTDLKKKVVFVSDEYMSVTDASASNILKFFFPHQPPEDTKNDFFLTVPS